VGAGAEVRFAACLIALVASSVALAVRDTPAAAQAPISFRASASAEGVRTGVVAEGGPVTNQVADAASPIAQAAVDSTAGSTALGSVAYPGDLIVTAPGLVAGFSGGQTSGAIPPYPLIAVAGSTTSPESSAEAPGTSMHAAADGRHAEAVATSGADGSGSTITATADVVVGDDDGITATASSDASSVTIGPLVLGRVAARSVVRRAPGADVTREATFEATGITVAGIDVRLTDEGLVLAGTTAPLDASPLQSILDGAGIAVHSIEEEETEDGVISAGLVVTKSQDLPAAITPATVTYTFGRAAASVSSVASSVPITVVPTPATSSGGGSDALTTDEGPSAGLPPPEQAAPPAAAAAPTSTPGVFAAETGPAPLFDLTSFYLVLVLAAACAGVALELLRHLGVRLRWT
jgi:hypothetical protein